MSHNGDSREDVVPSPILHGCIVGVLLSAIVVLVVWLLVLFIASRSAHA